MDLYSMIEAGGHVKFEVTGEDLCKFADRLIEKAQEMKAREADAVQSDEKWLTTKEVAELCRVKPITVNAWKKAGYITGSTVGKKQFYALSEIKKLLNGIPRKQA